MTLDYKIARHVCNVVRRQVQEHFPDLYLYFVVHKENTRADAFQIEKEQIAEHPAGNVILNCLSSSEFSDVLQGNMSHFFSMVRPAHSGFFRFFKRDSCLALSFINYARFSSEDDFRNHVFHLVWHAIVLYREVQKERCKDKILWPDFSEKKASFRNLEADIFSASVQKLQGRENALELLLEQRVRDTLHPTVGFCAEAFPFFVCVDALRFLFKNKIENYEKDRNPLIAAVRIVEDVEHEYSSSSVEQWRIFAWPAQEMAWAGSDVDDILGAAIYTSEDTYVQSIADVIAEQMDIKPQVMTHMQGYNPFTNQDVNERLHRKRCDELIGNILNRIESKTDVDIFWDVAWKHNYALLQSFPLGWCASALVSAAEFIFQSSLGSVQDVLGDAKVKFQEEVDSVAWDTLVHFSQTLLQHKRDGMEQTIDNAVQVAKVSDEFLSIYRAFIRVDEQKRAFKMEEDVFVEKPGRSGKDVNITDFISPNAIKKQD